MPVVTSSAASSPACAAGTKASVTPDANKPPEKSRNARAQKAHRERKNLYVKQLEQKVTTLSAAVCEHKTTIDRLESELARVQEENHNLRIHAARSSRHSPTPSWSGSTLSTSISRESPSSEAFDTPLPSANPANFPYLWSNQQDLFSQDASRPRSSGFSQDCMAGTKESFGDGYAPWVQPPPSSFSSFTPATSVVDPPSASAATSPSASHASSSMTSTVESSRSPSAAPSPPSSAQAYPFQLSSAFSLPTIVESSSAPPSAPSWPFWSPISAFQQPEQPSTSAPRESQWPLARNDQAFWVNMGQASAVDSTAGTGLGLAVASVMDGSLAPGHGRKKVGIDAQFGLGTEAILAMAQG